MVCCRELVLIASMNFIRVHKGKESDKDAFLTLTDCPNDRFAFAAPLQAFKSEWGMDETLKYIGFCLDYVNEKRLNGFSFSILRFQSAKFWRADYASLKSLLRSDNYPELKFDTDEWNKMVVGNFNSYMALWNEIRQRGKADCEYFDYPHLLCSSRRDCNLSALELRKFLFFEFGMRSLFRGDGFAYTEDGGRGVEEFLVPNLPRCDYSDFSVETSEAIELRIE